MLEDSRLEQGVLGFSPFGRRFLASRFAPALQGSKQVLADSRTTPELAAPVCLNPATVEVFRRDC